MGKGKRNRDKKKDLGKNKVIDVSSQNLSPLQSDIKEADKHLIEGLKHSNNDNNDEAIKSYTKAIEIIPDYAEAYGNRGNAYFSKDEFDLAIKDYDKVIKIDPRNPITYYNRGNAYANKDEFDLAIKDYDKAIEIKSDRFEPYYNKGNAYFNKGEFDLAIKDYDKVIEINPNYANTYNNKSIALFRLGKYKETIESSDKSIAIDKNNTLAYYYKGIALIELNKYEEAKECYLLLIRKCIKRSTLNYITSMNIYQLRHLLLKEKNKILITEIDELTNKYIEEIVKSEHNKNEEEIKKYSIKNDDNKNRLKRDKNGKIILYQYSHYNKNAIYRIKNRQMYFSDPLKFNDPFDPLIRVLDKEHSEGLIKLLNFRVSCLSPIIDSLLLWSHYADKHQGICIAYDITELVKQDDIIFRRIEHIDKFPKPRDGLMLDFKNKGIISRRIEPMDEFPKPRDELMLDFRNSHIKPNNKETLIDTFTKKQNVWEYEKEYRLILQTDKEKDFLQKVPIKNIYLGRDMLENDKEFIITMIKKMNRDNLKYKKGEYNINVYSMGISDTDIFKLEATQEV